MSTQSPLPDVPTHPCGFEPKFVAKVYRRRGRLHAFERFDPKRTALVVVDLNTGSVRDNEDCRAIVPRVNQMSAALRAAGGKVAWVVSDFEANDIKAQLFGAEDVLRLQRQCNAEAKEIWHQLEVQSSDIIAHKSGMSAFFPGKCDLHRQLQAIHIDTLLIAGNVTSVCCESSARDACELDYRVTIVFDACASYARVPAQVSLATFYRAFGDVRPASEIIELISAGTQAGSSTSTDNVLSK